MVLEEIELRPRETGKQPRGGSGGEEAQTNPRRGYSPNAYCLQQAAFQHVQLGRITKIPDML